MKELTKKQLIDLIPIWKEILKLRATLGMKTVALENIGGYVTSVEEFLSQDLPYKQYFKNMCDQRICRTPGSDKTAVDQFFSFLLVCWLIEEHPDPEYKLRKWGTRDGRQS